MKIEEEIVLKILALGLPDSTPNHRLEYLLKKMYQNDSLTLDYANREFLQRIKEVAEISKK